MNAAFPMLQSYWKREDPTANVVFFVVLGFLFLFVLVSSFLNRKKGKNARSSLAGGAYFSRSAFRRAASESGLGDPDIRFLEEFARASKTSNPEFVFRNPGRLDSFFKDALRHIDKTAEMETVAEERRADLLRIRETLEIHRTLGPQISSTRQLRPKTTLSFVASDESNYPSVVVASEAGGLAVEPPPDELGRPVHFRRGTKLSVFFYGTGHQGYSFKTRVRGYEEYRGKLVLVIKHSDSVTALPSRRHQRRDLREACTFRRVRVEVRKERGKSLKNVFVENMPIPGTAVDISAGGISIQTANPLDAQEYLKIDFDVGEGSFVAFGIVVRTNRLRGGGVMHVRFVKISRKAINSVLAYVYGYSE